jgi:hypothetical protein
VVKVARVVVVAGTIKQPSIFKTENNCKGSEPRFAPFLFASLIEAVSWDTLICKWVAGFFVDEKIGKTNKGGKRK